ncbi:hypothetical protein JAAARDRAFT_196811 [Jaapia argillacea MUCL 33604]|uniref:tRNA-guanine(15) transglycosylase-like domain-containing protein n=1 Tax=Jaapia argillacea MUCL 33604 TaxID=933084 RepID=A0A067PRW2_9AGAM|nr:hypothetical protein JAAARDRAFT_196811 [Jaapia argillacea MUCL 33604]
MSTLTFHLDALASTSTFSPRLGRVILSRPDDSTATDIETPGPITATSRGIVPHLSRDNLRATNAIRWVHIPFESFLDRNPPILTAVGGPFPLHTFLGYSPSKNVISLSLRDPFDGREMPPNSNKHVSANCIRGVRKVDQSTWRSYYETCQPDLVVALTDTPYTPPPHSQKRLTKSIERSIAWLGDTLRSSPPVSGPNTPSSPSQFYAVPKNILVHMAGGTSVPAREAFSAGLTEKLYGKEAQAIHPLPTLDEGVCGYTFDLVPLRTSLTAHQSDQSETEGQLTPTSAPPPRARRPPNSTPLLGAINSFTPHPELCSLTLSLIPLLRASLGSLPPTKPRIVNSALSPHEILQMIRDVGIDLFDSHWAQRAADIGVALDFTFPVPEGHLSVAGGAVTGGEEGPRRQSDGKINIGHNLYDEAYKNDYSRLSSSFLDGLSSSTSAVNPTTPLVPVCPCIACSPLTPSSTNSHSTIDILNFTPDTLQPPFTRSYLHHLLHTHEMSSHSLLTSHNLSVLSAFFSGIRLTLKDGGVEHFSREVERFTQVYDADMRIFDEARLCWAEVELARGKGRLAREKVKQAESSLGTAVEV